MKKVCLSSIKWVIFKDVNIPKSASWLPSCDALITWCLVEHISQKQNPPWLTTPTCLLSYLSSNAMANLCLSDLQLVCFVFSQQECPSGLVDEETFKTIYSQFFPQGGTACWNVLHLIHYNVMFDIQLIFNLIRESLRELQGNMGKCVSSFVTSQFNHYTQRKRNIVIGWGRFRMNSHHAFLTTCPQMRPCTPTSCSTRSTWTEVAPSVLRWDGCRLPGRT